MHPLLRSFVFAFGCCLTATSAWAGDVRHVVLIRVDGLVASYLKDSKAELPTLRKLMAEGASAQGMITSFPSVTWPSHTSLVTGVQPAKHGVIGNTVWDRKNNRGLTYIGDPELTKDQAVRVPTLLLAGERDVLVSRTGMNALASEIPDARAVRIGGAGHLACVTHAERVATEARSFFHWED